MMKMLLIILPRIMRVYIQVMINMLKKDYGTNSIPNFVNKVLPIVMILFRVTLFLLMNCQMHLVD